MDPIIAVYNLKLTVRSGADPSQIASLTNDQVGDAAAGALEDLLGEGGVDVTVNATSVERVDD